MRQRRSRHASSSKSRTFLGGVLWAEGICAVIPAPAMLDCPASKNTLIISSPVEPAVLPNASNVHKSEFDRHEIFPSVSSAVKRRLHHLVPPENSVLIDS